MGVLGKLPLSHLCRLRSLLLYLTMNMKPIPGVPGRVYLDPINCLHFQSEVWSLMKPIQVYSPSQSRWCCRLAPWSTLNDPALGQTNWKQFLPILVGRVVGWDIYLIAPNPRAKCSDNFSDLDHCLSYWKVKLVSIFSWLPRR